MGASAAATEPTAFASTVTCWETSLMFSGMVMVHILPCVELDRATIG
jgi:hypothetical protein